MIFELKFPNCRHILIYVTRTKNVQISTASRKCLRYESGINVSSNICTEWYTIYDIYQLLHVSTPRWWLIYYYCTTWMSPVTGLFSPVLLLNQRWSPPLRLQVSHCSTFRIMCDVPSTAVFCSESIECFPGTASRFFLKLLVTIPVATIYTACFKNNDGFQIIISNSKNVLQLQNKLQTIK